MKLPPIKALYPFIALFLVLAAWSFASPVGSSADEMVHLGRTYCYTGDDLCPPSLDFVEMPELWPYAPNCWGVPNFQIINKCNTEKTGPSFIQVERPESGTYSPIFYKMMALFFSKNIELSVSLMRLFNSLLMTIVAAFSSHLLRDQYKYDMNLWILLIPNVSFYVASVNPTSWSIIALYGLACSLISIACVGINRSNMVLLSFSFFISMSGRPDTKYLGFLFLISACTLAFTSRRMALPIILKCFGFMIVISAPIVIFVNLILTNKYQLSKFSGVATPNSLNLIIPNLRKTPPYLSEILSSTQGSYASSFLVKPFPTILCFFILFLLITSIQYSSTVVRLLIYGLGGAILILINYISFIWGLPLGDSIQPRYFLPIVVAFFIFVGFESNRHLAKRSFKALSTIIVGISIIALHTTIRRWSVGLFEFSKPTPGFFYYFVDGKQIDISQNKINLTDGWKTLLFLDPKWSPLVIGGQWTVLLLVGIGGIILISTRGSLNELVDKQTK